MNNHTNNWVNEAVQEFYGIYYCKRCGCKIDKQPKHPMVYSEPVPFSVAYPLCEKHAKELIDIDLNDVNSEKTDLYEEKETNCEPTIDDSYTGQIATLKKQIDQLKEENDTNAKIVELEIFKLLIEMHKNSVDLHSVGNGWLTVKREFNHDIQRFDEHNITFETDLLTCLKVSQNKGWESQWKNKI